MANTHRGEVDCTIAGVRHLLRPTFGALVEFEDAVRMPAYRALTDIAEGRATARLIATAIWAGRRGAAADPATVPTVEQIGAELQRDGLSGHLQTAFRFLANALASDAELSKQAELLTGKGAAAPTPTT